MKTYRIDYSFCKTLKKGCKVKKALTDCFKIEKSFVKNNRLHLTCLFENTHDIFDPKEVKEMPLYVFREFLIDILNDNDMICTNFKIHTVEELPCKP